MEDGEASFTSPLSHKKMVSDVKKEERYKGISFVDLLDSPPKKFLKTEKVLEEENFDHWDPCAKTSPPITKEVFKEEENFDHWEDQTQVSMVIKSIDDFKETILTMLRQPVEKLVTPLTKESIRPLKKEKLSKIFSPYAKDGNKYVQVTTTPTGCYIKSSKTLVGPSIPDWLSSLFKPKEIMNLTSDQCAMASYIFGRSTDDKEVLIQPRVPFCDGTRKLLSGLKPTKFLYGDIIDLVVCMMTDKAKKGLIDQGCWFLPSVFSQYVISWNAPIPSLIKKYRKKFMGDLGMISKIFLPVHDAEYLHWFLLVIDFNKKQVIYLDSLPNRSARRGRNISIKKLTVYMEELLMDPAFHVTGTKHTPNVSEFSLVTPNDLGVQADMSWMMVQD
ncbi:uncharacterized protein LOC123909608 isoform X2 [Trifolium pratense]|uniref:uncharacterized protein LOC123909608 isoform X2 n=1 Tax=Trifolium pratense TaxID=57577 RepID=UPI001E69618B|nr:uncharacterized protein LOC123909608 isoform X2 [Trifolium pratense]